MNPQIEERIKIVRSLKSVYDSQNKRLGKREKWLKLSASFDYWIVMILLLFLIILAIAAIFQIEPMNEKWQKSGLLVLMTYAIAIKSPYSFIELLLLKHVKKIKNLNLSFPEFLNQDLKEMIDRLNSKKTRFNYIILAVIFIVFASALQVFELNPYWNFFTFPVILLSIVLLIRINLQISPVKKNIKRFESISKTAD